MKLHRNKSMNKRKVATESKLLKVLGLVAIVVLAGCQTNIPDDVDGYVDSFIHEAELRGHDMSAVRRGLTIEFGELPDNKAGSSKKSFFSRTITLASLIWKQMNDRQREMLVFHELGHCVLERDHKNDRLPLGQCASIMREGGEEACVADIFSESWRSYYIDELFNPEVPSPDWYQVQNLSELTLRDTLVQKEDSLMYESSQMRHYAIMGSLPFDNAIDDYLITLEYDSLNYTYGFGWDGLAISLSPETGVFSVSCIGKLERMTYSLYSDEIQPTVPLEFSVLKIQGFYHFYVNGIEKHVMSTGYFRLGTTAQQGNMQFITYGGSAPTATFRAMRIERGL